ncbi:Carboxypeptidase Y [Phytophthora citrophthora]|uniref:Carboxypeptidase n=1 Tax=Phytophthora citrophthora TaxID=4793 RepID=A0AAD9GVZ8_9STRA|nr:Carboxypeptidase Y [Phytophthora citrophthora]
MRFVRSSTLLVLVCAFLVDAIAVTQTTCKALCGLEKQDAGYIKIPNRVDTHYFYWYFESRNKPSSDPLLVWLPGGPGIGGTYGLLAENGPCTVNSNTSTEINKFSWTAEANMVWVDIPANAGFSYSSIAEDDEFNDDRVSESVFNFLQGFLKKHQELQGREVFLVGESYGGHIVPSVAHYIWKKQGNHLFSPATSDSIPIKLRGIALGNPLTDPVETLSHFVDMAENRYNITLVNETQLASMRAAAPVCRDLMVKCQTNTSVCVEAGSYCVSTQWVPVLASHRNPYDIRQECNTSDTNMSACIPRVPPVKAYLDLPEVREFLGVHPSRREWILLNATINGAFFGPPSYPALQSVADKVSELLNAGVRVLMYVGDADLLCNVYATEAIAKKLNWFGAAGFNAAKVHPYSTTSGIKNAGSVRSFSSLTLVDIYNAGHMAPGDQPQVALDMITKFIRNDPL